MNQEEWNTFVEEHPESTFFHQWSWRNVIENTYNFQSNYLVAKSSEGIQGVLPLFIIKQKTGKKLISVPFSTQGGVLYKTEKAKESLIKQAKDVTIQNNLDYLELRQEKDIGTNLRTKDYYCHMKLKLSPNPDDIWNNADRKLRNAVRKSEKLGLKTDKGLHYLDEFHSIFSANMRDLGTPVDKKEFFMEIIKQFPNQVDIIVAKLDREVIGAVFLLKHKKTIKAEWASSVRKYFGYNASQAMYWRAIEDACKEEFEIFDFGRSIENEGTYLFKKKFGAIPHRLNYKYFIRRGEMPDTRKTNWKRQIFAKSWSKIPLKITNKLGPKIRKNFP